MRARVLRETGYDYLSIVGNTCLYGATDGKLFAAGQAGERFAVRNSGATNESGSGTSFT